MNVHAKRCRTNYCGSRRRTMATTRSRSPTAPTPASLGGVPSATTSPIPIGGLVHHSGRGSQYVSIRYTERSAEAGIEPSVGSVGDSYDKALAETINGFTKAEVIHRRRAFVFISNSNRFGRPICKGKYGCPARANNSPYQKLNPIISGFRFMRSRSSDWSERDRLRSMQIE